MSSPTSNSNTPAQTNTSPKHNMASNVSTGLRVGHGHGMNECERHPKTGTIVSSAGAAGNGLLMKHTHTNHPHNTHAETSSELVMTAAAALASLTKQGSNCNTMNNIENTNPHEQHIMNMNHPHLGAFGAMPSGSRMHRAIPRHQHAHVNIQQGPSPFATTGGMLVPQQLKNNTRQKAMRFPVKLMQILSSGEHENIISWTPDGLSFVVKKPTLLVSEVLPSYFKEVKYSSFTRKLHRWGFIKILRGKEISAYFHKNFRRGNFELCARMHCSKGGGNSEDVDVSHLLQQTNIMPRMMHEREIIHEHEQSLREQMARERLAFSNIPSLADAGMHDPNHSGGMNKMHHYYDLNASLPREAAFPRPVVGQQHQFLNQQEQYFASMNNATPPRFNNNSTHNAIPFNNGMPLVQQPSQNGLEFERARHSIQHRRIMEEAWNALSWESKMRVSREKGIHPNSAMHLSHGN